MVDSRDAEEHEVEEEKNRGARDIVDARRCRRGLVRCGLTKGLASMENRAKSDDQSVVRPSRDVAKRLVAVAKSGTNAW